MPVLAFIAYIAVLTVGFLGDDFLLLGLAREPGVDTEALLPGSRWFFYRPMGVFFTWELGWSLWGYNPFPYHLVQLLMHTAVSLLLALWLAYATGRKLLGWMAGAIFAVFPSHGEAVGWIATQWDVLSALLGIGSLWCFTAWWRNHSQHDGDRARDKKVARNRHYSWPLYAAALLLYTLATLTKEGLFAFALMLGIGAWFTAPPPNRGAWGRLVFSMLPFFVVIGANLALRLFRLGELGNYPFARTDYGNFIWDSLLLYLRFMFAPLNPSLWGSSWVQVVGLFSTVAIVVGIMRFGRTQGRVLSLGVLWFLLSIVPVLSIPIMGKDDFRDTRFLYLPAAGYCIVVATLLYDALLSTKRWRSMLAMLLGAMLGAGIVASWVQVSPWRIASVQTTRIIRELLTAIPPQPRPNGMVWFVENMPQLYKGALMLNWGLGLSRVFTDEKADYPRVERVPDASQALITDDERDAYAIRFDYIAHPNRDDEWKIGYLAGITSAAPPPTTNELGENGLVWDFRRCAPDVLSNWVASEAQVSCEPERGLLLEPGNADPQMVGPPLSIELPDNAKFVRLRIGARYVPGVPSAQASQYNSEWFWKGPGMEYSAERQRTTPIKQDGETHVYWTFIPPGEVGQTLTGLRFDPGNAQVATEIEWIAIDLVK